MEEFYRTDFQPLILNENLGLVGIDPGKCDLIYCVYDCNKEANKFRYSQDQRRRKESKSKIFLKYGLH